MSYSYINDHIFHSSIHVRVAAIGSIYIVQHDLPLSGNDHCSKRTVYLYLHTYMITGMIKRSCDVK